MTENIPSSAKAGLFSLPVLVAALGYFVDIYDLLLFGIVRVASLKDLGLNPEQVSAEGGRIINWQMAGLILGGVLWGVLGDKRGRLSVLFGSIITYSLANVACGFLTHITFMNPLDYYALMRFVAGIGLAGELGAGITLVSESIPNEKRAIGTSLVAGIGVWGAIVAYFTVELFNWETAYLVGGSLGFCLLLLRIGVIESGMFTTITDQKHISRGNFFSFFTNANRFSRYIKCIGVGVPTWFITGILASFSNEFGTALGISDDIQPGLAITWLYVGMAIGDLSNGFISQWLGSRKKAITLFMSIALLFSGVYFFGHLSSIRWFYILCLGLGFGNGYWAMFVTISAEQFGTNLRASAATSVPNMVRGFLIPMTLGFQALKPLVGVSNAGVVVGLVSFAIGFAAILTIPETHNKDLNFVEE